MTHLEGGCQGRPLRGSGFEGETRWVRASHEKDWEGKGKSLCKGPKEGKHLASCRN